MVEKQWNGGIAASCPELYRLLREPSTGSCHFLKAVPHPLLSRVGAHQLIAFMINDGIASAINVAFYIELPNALAASFAEDGDDVLTISHGLPDVKEHVS